MLFQIQGGYRLDNANLDFLGQEKAFKVVVHKIMTMTRIKLGKKSASSNEIWTPSPYINSAKMLIGHSRARSCRRPFASDAEWAHVARAMFELHAQNIAKETFGIGHKPILRIKPTSPWRPSVKHAIFEEIEKTAEMAKTKKQHITITPAVPTSSSTTNGPCYFGHTTTSGRRDVEFIGTALLRSRCGQE